MAGDLNSGLRVCSANTFYMLSHLSNLLNTVFELICLHKDSAAKSNIDCMFNFGGGGLQTFEWTGSFLMLWAHSGGTENSELCLLRTESIFNLSDLGGGRKSTGEDN